ncbi:hypothetical protein ROS60_002003 [Pluralibacter gergoviae]|uniref:hypothetical protein n=1 Tax=Pluralibacter gergoviae TaxID=61647 RepID=UPI00090827BB|nr:hypothetical protein [Pluralibacter gergoviae]ELG9929440.1 hypothetical protein [Pluralibacter gergoviae]ELK5591843.1 hypothetical protein [Pluralibacter gergoviae]MDU4432658.1 hypothetical protein [Pluralibacter gergoviae]
MLDKKATSWDFMFVLLYVFFSAKVLVSTTTIDPSYSDFLKYFFTILFFGVMGISAIFINKKELFFFTVIGLFCLLTFFISKSAAIYASMVMVFLSIVSKRIDHKKISLLCLVGNFLLVLIILPFLLQSNTQYMVDYRYGLRYTFGFYHPNYTGIVLLYMYISLCWFFSNYIQRRIICFLLYTIIVIPIVFIIDTTKSRTAEFLLLIYYISISISIIFNKKSLRKLSFIAIALSIILIIGFQFYTAMNYSNGGLIFLNEILAGRISLSSYVFQNFGLPPFLYGLNIESYEPIDFFFIELFYTNGVLVSSILVFLVLIKVRNIQLSISELIIILVCIITTLTQRFILVPCFGYALFIIFSKRNIENE